MQQPGTPSAPQGGVVSGGNAPAVAGGDALAGPAGPPTSAAEYRALVDRRDEMQRQLGEAQGRRVQATVNLRQASGAAERATLQSQVASLDSRIERLQAEVDHANDLILATDPDVLTEMRSQNQAVAQHSQEVQVLQRLASDVIPLAGIISVFVLFPIAFAMARFIWKRSTAAGRSQVPDLASVQRLEQLQQSVDAIAVEVERISEGQRFVAKQLSGTAREKLGA